MSNFNEVKNELMNYLMARTPLVIINTNERERVERMLSELANAGSVGFYYYTDAKQVKGIGMKLESVNTDDDPIGFFTDLVKKQRKINIVIGDVRRVSDDNIYSRDLMNLLYLARENNSTVFIITTDQVWDRISNFGMVTTLDYPDSSERTALIKKFMTKYDGYKPIDWDEDDIKRVSAVLRGFTEIQIENILASEIIGKEGLYKANISSLASQKQKIYPKIGSVQYIPLSKEYSVAGMENLKTWLDLKRRVFFMPDEELKYFDLKAPKGMLLVGVPGCGKSLSAKLVAQKWDLPLFRFDIGAVFDKWVGESEKKMREALQFIENISPCVLWIDEIEKVLATSDSGNETGKRVLGEFLFWIQESESKVFMVATANNVNALPYELYRKGRFSEVFFAGLPNAEERRATIRHYAGASLKKDLPDQMLDKLVEVSEGYSYSDIETAIKEITQSIISGNIDGTSKKVTFDDIVGSFKSIIPISQINPELVEGIKNWGEGRAINVSRQEEDN